MSPPRFPVIIHCCGLRLQRGLELAVPSLALLPRDVYSPLAQNHTRSGDLHATIWSALQDETCSTALDVLQRHCPDRDLGWCFGLLNLLQEAGEDVHQRNEHHDTHGDPGHSHGGTTPVKSSDHYPSQPAADCFS